MLTPTKKRVLPVAPKTGSPRTTKTFLNKDKENKFGSRTPIKKKEKNVTKTVESPSIALIKTQHIKKESSVSKTPGIENAEEDSFFGLQDKKTIQVEEKKSINHRASLLLNSEHALQPNYDDSSIKVAVRVRPFSDKEFKKQDSNVVAMDGNVTILKNTSGGKDHEFTYDYSFWSFDADNPAAPYTAQEDVYRCLAKPLLQCSFDGYNTCLFAYGQTGSGKSYTIMGYEDEDTGIVPRFSKDLFDEVNYLKEHQRNVSYSVEISFYEIYNEKIFDLLSFNEATKQRLCVREHPDYGPYVQGLSTHIIGTHQDILDWLEVGNKSRATAATGMNDKSSRSHSVFTVFLTQVTNQEFDGTETQLQKQSKINLIDLAGSERASKVFDDKLIRDAHTMDTRLKEGGCINKSLHTLGKVISLLSDVQLKPKRKPLYIPYRDSVLTWLLKESLGGNAKTTMIATISPSHHHYSETLSTLRYAQQTRSIVNKARVNEDPKSKLIREMLGEIQRLKHSQRRTGDFSNALENEVKLLRTKLQATQGELASSARSYQEKLNQSEKKQKEVATRLRRSGVAFTKLEQRLPSLVNLNEDPQLAEVLLYILQEGVTTVGSQVATNNHDIQLNGNLVAHQHCKLSYSNDKVIIIPEGDALTYINGNLITTETILHHGDRLVIGGDHFFRFNHPKEAMQMKDEKTSSGRNVKNFEFAKEELLSKQNERLEEELEEARLRAEEDAMEQIKQAQLKADEEINSQRAFFEHQMDKLQKKLEDSTGKQKEAEEGKQSAQQIINQLREHQAVLENEILSNRKKLQMEALAAKQLLEDTKNNRSVLISSLEREKQRMQDDVEKMKNAKANRKKIRSSINMPVNQAKLNDYGCRRNLLKISLMIHEANKISQNLNQDYKFSRDDLCNEGHIEIRIEIHNTKTKKSCLLDLDRFEEELNRMKDMSTDKRNGSVNLFNEKDFTWCEETFGYHKKGRTRVSLSESHLLSTSLNQSFDENGCQGINASCTHDETYNKTHPYIEGESQLYSMPSESTRLSSVQQPNMTGNITAKSDLSVSQSQVFDTILEIENEGETSIIASLIKLIITIYTDWKTIMSRYNVIISDGVATTSTVDNPVIRMACNLKCLKDQSSILCAVHEAVGLDGLKKISIAFKADVLETCCYVKNYVWKNEDRPHDCKEKFKELVFQMVELLGALSLAAVDHIKHDDDGCYINNSEEVELCLFFLKQQNRFLVTMMDEALSTVTRGIEDIKHFQLTQTHEMSEDLVDGVMNILTSTSTLIQRCKDLMMVYADINITEHMNYYAKECFILRTFLTSVVDYNESIINLVHQSKEIAANCDALDNFTDIPVEVADTTKRICAAGRELYNFLADTKLKQLESDALQLFHECLQKFDFAGKTVRVGVAIVVQEVEKDLNITEEHSILSFVQSDVSFNRSTTMCPLNRTSLDISATHPQIQEKFKNRLSSTRPDMFISRYMDTTCESF